MKLFHPLWLILPWLTACGANLTNMTATLLETADVGYGVAVHLCDQKEQAIITRQGSTEEDDHRDMTALRRRCDTVFATFEAVREHQDALKAAVLELEKIP